MQNIKISARENHFMQFMQVLQLQSDEQQLHFEKRMIEDRLSFYERMIGIDGEAKGSELLEELQKLENQYKEIRNQIEVKMEEMRKIAKEDAELKKEQEDKLLRQQRERDAKLEQSVQISEVQIAEEITEEIDELEQLIQISEVQIKEEIPEKAESRDKKQEAAEEEEKEEGEEGKLQRRLWERQAANQQTIETVKMYQEPLVLVIRPNLSSYEVKTLCSEVNSPHQLGNFHDKQYSEVYPGLFRRNSRRKAKHKTKASNQRNNRRKKKVKVSLDFRLGNEVPIHKKCKSHLCQQISNPCRKEVRDEGGTVKVVPLGKQIELVSYY
jgi:hypothetical protein